MTKTILLTRKKPTLLLLFNSFILLLLIFGCASDEEMVQQDNKRINSKIISFEEFSKNTLAVESYNKASKVLGSKKKNKTNARLVYYDGLDFYIDVDNILYIEKEGYHSYTLPIYRDSISGKVENLVFSYDGTKYEEYLTKYELTEEEKEKISKNEYVPLDNKTEISHLARSGGGPCYELVRVVTYSNIPGQREYSVFELREVDCDPESPSDDGEQEENSEEGGGGGPPGHPPYIIPISGNDGGGGPVGPGPGLGSGGGVNPPVAPVITVPLIDISKKRECLKIAALMNTGNHRSDVVALSEFVSDPENEHGFVYDENGEKIDLVPAPELNVPNTAPIKSFNHVHNDTPDGTLSIFSDADLDAIALLLKSNNINTGTFVATLSTSKGTYYALTIFNVEKFKAFYFHKLNTLGADLSILPTYSASSQKYKDLIAKYFDQDTGSIKKNDPNNANVLNLFLNFMNEADMGISLFEADPAFETFTKVSKVPNGPIKRENCN